MQGTRGWEKRKQPNYTPSTKHTEYRRAYYQRKKAARKQQPATGTEEE